MVVLVCPASFKGSLSAGEAAAAMADGVRAAGHEALQKPLADGGEGTLDAMLSAGGVRRAQSVRGPYGATVEAQWGVLPDGVAVVEMAQASGIARAGPKPWDLTIASTFGTGQLIAAALREGNRLIVGLGGSATNDGGTGALRALGVRFLDARGLELTDAVSMARLESIDVGGLDPSGLEVTAAADVDNRLVGPEGATWMFGRQKGGTPEVLQRLEEAMSRYAKVLEQVLGWDVASAPGAGAAGGLGTALLGCLKARFRPGIDVVMDATRFDEAVAKAELIITGEGRLDAQSLHGKAVAGVLRRALGRPVWALCGRVDLDEARWREWGLTRAVATSPEHPPLTSTEAASLLRQAARDALLA